MRSREWSRLYSPNSAFSDDIKNNSAGVTATKSNKSLQIKNSGVVSTKNEGDFYLGWKILKIDPDGVLIESNGEIYQVYFDGHPYEKAGNQDAMNADPTRDRSDISVLPPSRDPTKMLGPMFKGPPLEPDRIKQIEENANKSIQARGETDADGQPLLVKVEPWGSGVRYSLIHGEEAIRRAQESASNASPAQ